MRGAVRGLLIFGLGLSLGTVPFPAGAQGGNGNPGGPEQLLYKPKTRHPLTLVEIYSEGLLFWNKQLSDAQATHLAKVLIDTSAKNALDARLVISALGTEGEIQKIRAKGGKSLIGNRDADSVITSTAKDLADRIKQAGGANKKKDEVLREALTARGKSLPPAQSKKYPERVLATYRKMCGQG